MNDSATFEEWAGKYCNSRNVQDVSQLRDAWQAAEGALRQELAEARARGGTYKSRAIKLLWRVRDLTIANSRWENSYMQLAREQKYNATLRARLERVTEELESNRRIIQFSIFDDPMQPVKNLKGLLSATAPEPETEGAL